MTPLERLERASWDLTWLPPDTHVVNRPEVLAVSCARDVPYLNAVLRTRATPDQLPALVEEVAAMHRERTSRWVVVDSTPTAALRDTLEGARYRATQTHDARLVHVPSAVLPSRPDTIAVRRVTDEATLRDCWAVIDAAFGPSQRHPNDLTAELTACASERGRIQRFVAYADGAPIASGGITRYPELSLALLWGGGTVPRARGRGAYRALVATRLACARRWDVGFAGLYARTGSSSPLVAKLGFARHGEMTYYTRDADT